MFERFTKEARAVVTAAVDEAGELGHRFVGPEHLLLGLLGAETGVASEVLHGAGLDTGRVRDVVRRRTPGDGLTDEDAESLRAVGIDLDVVLEHLKESFGPDSLPRSQPRGGHLRFSRSAKKTLQLALREAIWLKSRTIGGEHILLGLLRCDDTETNAVLGSLGVKPDDLRSAVLRTIGRAA